MPNYPYDEIGTQMDRTFVQGLNKNFDDIEQDINEVIEPLQAVLDGKFDDASLATEFEARAQAKLEEIQPEFYQFQQDTSAQLARAYEFQADTSAQLAQTADKEFLNDIRQAPLTQFTKPYNKNTSIYNPKLSNFDGLRAGLARAKSKSGLCNIVCLGSSITAGQGAEIGVSDYPTFLREFLESKGYPIAGTGLVPCHHADSGKDVRWTFTGDWKVFTTGIFTRTLVYEGSTPFQGEAATATFQSDLPGTIAEVWYSDTSGKFSISVDDGEEIIITPIGEGGVVKKWTKTGLPNTKHKIKIKYVSTPNTRIFGAGVRNSYGVLVHNLGQGGGELKDVYQGGTLFSPLNIAKSLISDFIIMDGQTNEARNSVNLETYRVLLNSIISDTPTTTDGTKKILMFSNIPANGLNLLPYRTILYEEIDKRNMSLLDLFDRWSSYSVANSLGYYKDAYHPNPIGNVDYASAVFEGFLF